MTIQGHATANDTQAIAQTNSPLPYSPLADTGLLVSQVGVTFSGLANLHADQATLLKQAVAQGINLIDTTELVERLELELEREGFVLLEKVGMLRGEIYEWAEARKMDGRVFPNIVKFSQDTDHCIHPDFLGAFLTRRLKRLNLATLDGFLLHNPELYLQWADRVGISLREAQRTFYQRIKLAFDHLEQEATDGRIQFYGISSNALTIRRDNPAFVSLSAILESGNYPHFKLLELPLNLMETDAVTQINQPNGLDSVLDAAEKASLAVLVKRPLSSQQADKRIRLVDVLPPDYPATPEDVSTAVDSLMALESEFRADILPALPLDADAQVDLQNKLRIGHMLQGKWGGFAGYWNWLDLRSYFILPEAQNAVQTLQTIADPPFTLPDWLNLYVEAVNELLVALTAFYQEQAHDEAQKLHEKAIASDPEWKADSLVGTAVCALLSTSPITSVMVDTLQPPEFASILSALQQPVEQKSRREAWKKITIN
jgi:aryl-alcohol dehydrogenase-like predicted oxidoreductase